MSFFYFFLFIFFEIFSKICKIFDTFLNKFKNIDLENFFLKLK